MQEPMCVKPPARLRKGLRIGLFLLALLGLILCGKLGLRLYQARKQRAAVEAIVGLGGAVRYQFQAVDGTRSARHQWLRRLLELDFSNDVVYVYLGGRHVSDDALQSVTQLTELRELHLGGTSVTGARLGTLRCLPALTILDLDGAALTDAGLAGVKELAHLETLDLDNTRISDAGLKHVRALSQLRVLMLDGTAVSASGLEALTHLQRLHKLYVDRTALTEADLGGLRAALPNLEIVR